MDLPSVEMALSILDSLSETDLSDPPTDLDNMDVDFEEVFGSMALTSSMKRKALSRSVISEDEPMTDTSDILNGIVSYLPDDRDLFNLSCSCKIFANTLIPEESAVWKQRFLARYDHPNVSESTQFAIAYQLRRFVLRHFIEFTHPNDKRLTVQLEVIRDMVIEAYNPSQMHLPAPSTSRNLAAFASPHNSPWIRIFLSCFFFPCRHQRYGQAHPIFDTLQLAFSHLLLSPASQMAHTIKSSRANYDLAVVYNWNKPSMTLYRKSVEEEASFELTQPETPKTPSLRSRKTPSPVAKPTHELDTHALLHIRNFWHRHLIEEPRGFESADIVENTYGKMAKELMSHGIIPKKWDKPLKNGDLQIATEWYGHYSTLGNWPRKKQELEEVQSLAEDWQKVDPLKLDFVISTNNEEDGFWSPIFRTIPAFQETTPDPKSPSCRFIRGLAPFVELSPLNNDRRTPNLASSPSSSQATLTLPNVPQLPKRHPYLAMRLRGVIHSIPVQPQPSGTSSKEEHGIPGWNRIVMVLYKPNKRYLIQVLEHAGEEFGDTFGTAITSQMMQNSGTTTQTINQLLNGGGLATQTLDPAEIDTHLSTYLCGKLLSNASWRDGSKLDKDMIEEMEEKFRLSEYLDWNDIDYAYAYEGVILPGGKIMLGRWWRVAMNGEGEGLEWSDALGEEDLGDAMDPNADTTGVGDGGASGSGHGQGQGQNEAENPAAANNRGRYKKLERGPFVFWC